MDFPGVQAQQDFTGDNKDVPANLGRGGRTTSKEWIPVHLPFIQQIVVEPFQELQYSRDKREELPAS